MALRTGHGHGRGVPRIEVVPVDELGPSIPATDPPLAGVTRRQDGTVDSSEAAKALGAKGGAVKARRVRLARSLGLSDLDQSEAFAPYRRSASAFRQHHAKELARLAGGVVSAGPCSMIASASLQLAASRFLFDQASRSGDAATFKTASSLANDSRQNLLAAYELATREAQARPQADPLAWLTAPAPTTTKLPPTPKDSSETKDASESNVGPANDKVDGPTNSGAT